MTTWVMAALGAALLLGSGFYGLRFYPPGEGYAEERRNNRISLAMLIAGILAIGMPWVLQALA